MRERIDVSEIEAQTKIRAKYLRALENEEWDLLPGPTFVKSFLRTYGAALGLDGKALVEEYRLNYERPSEPPEPIVASPRRVRVPRGPSRAGGAGPSRGYMALVGIVGIVIVLLIVGLISGGSGGSSPKTSSTASSDHAEHGGSSRNRAHTGAHHQPASALSNLASLKLEPSGEVYVCLIGDNELKRIPGVILKPGAPEPTYHARRFLLTLGNNAVSLIVNGIPQTVPASSQAIGYSITRAGLKPLAAGELPTCT